MASVDTASVVACEDAPAVEGEAVSTGVGLVTVPECAAMTEEGGARVVCDCVENRQFEGGPE